MAASHVKAFIKRMVGGLLKKTDSRQNGNMGNIGNMETLQLQRTSLSDLQSYGYILTDKGEVTNYLGVQVDHKPENGSFTLSHPYLVERILALLGNAVSEANTKSTPTVPKEILHKDEHGPDRKQSWS